MDSNERLQLKIAQAMKYLAEASVRLGTNGIDDEVYRMDVLASLNTAIDYLREVRTDVYAKKP